MASCAGAPPAPITVSKASDKFLNCDQISSQIQTITREVNELSRKENSKQKSNYGLAAAGTFLIVPFFFMNLTESEKVELNAARGRYFALERMARERNCAGFENSNPEVALKDSLRSLSRLYEEGIITKEEYLSKRNEIIQNFEL